MPGDAVLAAEGLRKSFRAGHRTVTALDGVSVRMRPGAVTGLIGPDGAGKTTFMRLASGLLVPDAGNVTVLGLDARQTANALATAATLAAGLRKAFDSDAMSKPLHAGHAAEERPRSTWSLISSTVHPGT